MIPDLCKSSMPNVYHVRSFFDDGTELCPLSEAIVIAQNELKALEILIEEDADEERKTDWKDQNTEVEQIGWASGDLSERVVIIASGYEDEA